MSFKRRRKETKSKMILSSLCKSRKLSTTSSFFSFPLSLTSCFIVEIKKALTMSSRSVGVVTRSSRREQQVNIVGRIPSEHDQDQDDDDDVVESTASAFDRAKRHKPRSSRRGTLVHTTHHQSEHANVELNDST